MTAKLMLTTLSACAILCFAQGNALPDPAVAGNYQEAPATKELSGKVTSFDANSQILKLQDVKEEIRLTASTKFAGGLTLASIKPGISVELTAAVMPDGKFEARELRPMS